jgi:hypothetical protein
VFQGDVTLEVKSSGEVRPTDSTSPLSRSSGQTISPTMTEPDNRQDLLSPFEYGVWVFLALAAATAVGVISYLAYVML